MLLRRYASLSVIALSAAAVFIGCAQSEPINVDDTVPPPGNSGAAGTIDPSNTPGTAGSGGPGIAGSSAGGTDPTGIGGASGSAGTGTSGQAGSGSAGTGTSGSAGVTGTGGSISGQGGSGFGGSAAGSTGSGGRGGTTGFGGRGGNGGTIGTAGRGGYGGTTGVGGAAGTKASGGSGGSTPDGGTPDGGMVVTFTDVYTNVLVPHCSGSNCHNPGSQKGIAFSTQTNAYNTIKSRITAGNGAGSSFYSTVNSGSMPPGGPKLSSTDLNKIKTWIDQGALNN